MYRTNKNPGQIVTQIKIRPGFLPRGAKQITLRSNCQSDYKVHLGSSPGWHSSKGKSSGGWLPVFNLNVKDEHFDNYKC